MKKIITLLFLITVVSLARADIYTPFSSDIYNHLRRLEALGYIKSGQLTTLPLSIGEIKRLVKEAEDNSKRDRMAREIINRIKKELPSDILKFEGDMSYSYVENNDSLLLNKNNNGIDIEKGSNLRLESIFSVNYKNAGFFVSPYFISNERYEQLSFNEFYGLFNCKKLEISFGKESQWWGGGQNGSILLSNNAEGLNVFKISNSTPIDFIVPFRFTFFISKLENNRADVKSPYMNGVRFTLKPFQYFEIGLSKTALYGGKGRKNDLGAFFDSLIGNKEKNTTNNPNNEPGDQRAGFDFKLIVPNQFQPFTFYIEAIGEDVSKDFPYPYKYAFIYSLYLPKILTLDKLELLVEHADTVYRQKNIWYNHHIFTQGYTYKGDIIGHYMGADAKDWFFKLRYNKADGYVLLSYEKLKKTLIDKVYEAYGISINQDVIDRLSLNLGVLFLEEEKDKWVISAGLRYSF